jgi:hypothetical protein
MTFEVGKPAHDIQKKCYRLSIGNGPVFKGRLTYPFDIEIEGESNAQYMGFVSEFLKRASPFFSKELAPAVFLERVIHTYSALEDLSGAPLKTISWIPAHALFFPNRYEIHWTLLNFERAHEHSLPGNELVEVNIVSSDRVQRFAKALPLSAQKLLRQKVRQARVKCALARLRLEQITEKYYARYGNFDGFSDDDSELSTEFEFNPNEAPRKI